MQVNPTYDKVQVGDLYTSGLGVRDNKSFWYYTSVVQSVQPVSKRFGKDDRIVNVQITSMVTGKVIDTGKDIWVSQLLKGLI